MDDADRRTLIDEWFRGYADRLFAYLLHRADRATAQDVLQELRAEAAEPSEIHLWPEHFDVAFEDRAVTYGGSPGDENHDEPYLYVAPWTAPPPAAGRPPGAPRPGRRRVLPP